MKQILFAASFAIASAMAADTFTGEIMDSQCADMGSHENMMKGEHASTAKECAIACVKKGGKYAFYDGKKAYALDNQKKAKDFAGQKVTITGKVDGDTIQVKDIQAK
jgi:hypothetical protein